MAPKKKKSSVKSNAVSVVLQSEIRDHDILLGRGNGIAQHSGNLIFRAKVWDFRKEYLHVQRNGKQAVAEEVLQELSEMDPPARFLERCEGQNDENLLLWVEVDYKKCLEKTCQALREKKNKAPPGFDESFSQEMGKSVRRKVKAAKRHVKELPKHKTGSKPGAGTNKKASSRSRRGRVSVKRFESVSSDEEYEPDPVTVRSSVAAAKTSSVRKSSAKTMKSTEKTPKKKSKPTKPTKRKTAGIGNSTFCKAKKSKSATSTGTKPPSKTRYTAGKAKQDPPPSAMDVASAIVTPEQLDGSKGKKRRSSDFGDHTMESRVANRLWGSPKQDVLARGGEDSKAETSPAVLPPNFDAMVSLLPPPLTAFFSGFYSGKEENELRAPSKINNSDLNNDEHVDLGAHRNNLESPTTVLVTNTSASAPSLKYGHSMLLDTQRDDDIDEMELSNIDSFAPFEPWKDFSFMVSSVETMD